MQSITGAGPTGISLTDDPNYNKSVVIDEEVIHQQLTTMSL